MSDWNADLYERFSDERALAARDLIAGIDYRNPHHMLDLGCGTGLSSAIMRARWPSAKLTAIDKSESMLKIASERLGDANLLCASMESFTPEIAQDIIVANASIQWVAEHGPFLAQAVRWLAPGGVLAVQMPNNLDEPSHRSMCEVARSAPYSTYIDFDAQTRGPLLSTAEYYDLLTHAGARVRTWETHYHHVLPGVEAIAQWFETTGLKPYLDPLPAILRTRFLADYIDALQAHYEVRADGNVLLVLPRLFFLAIARGSVVRAPK